MDSNKDEGLKCLRIGKAAMEAGDKGRALKFLKMAQRLYPSAQVEEMLASLLEIKREEEATTRRGAIVSKPMVCSSGIIIAQQIPPLLLLQLLQNKFLQNKLRSFNA
jgi:DnaJ family protein B protein 12